MLTCLFVGGHCLLEGVPGLGKTLLVRTLAKTLDLDFSRIQFTPDLMPADILGTNMVMETPDGKRFFEFQRGPIFTQICLADEINRATPKTQSAMLETMQEGSVTAAGNRYQLKQPFFVMATQNPIEQEGTYPLPEAQLDRFFFKLVVGYCDRKELATIVDRTTRGETIEPVKVMDGEEILRWQALVREVILADARAGLPGAAGAGHASRKARSPCRSPTSTSAGAPVPARPRRWPWRPRSGRCWTAATTSVSRTSAASTCRPCGTASSSTSRPRPKASSPTRCCWSCWRSRRRKRGDKGEGGRRKGEGERRRPEPGALALG